MATLVRFLKIVTIGTARALSEKKPVMSMAMKSRLTGSQSIATSMLKREYLTIRGKSRFASMQHSTATEFCEPPPPPERSCTRSEAREEASRRVQGAWM